jgi:hypothetical protein
VIDPYLTSLPQWIVVRLVERADGRTDKIPLNWVTGAACDAHDPAHHTTHAQAVAAATARGPGHCVGFVLTAQDDLVCLDIDGALQPDNTWSALALQMIQELPGCAIEVSQSGRGLHLWGRYPNPPEHKCKRTDLHVELYTKARFIAVALGAAHNGQIAPRCEALPGFAARWFPPPVRQATHGTGPRPEWRGPTDDQELLRRALRTQGAGAAFGNKATFADLWDRNVSVLSRAYPGDGDGGVDWSSADAALAQHLAFWTGADQDRMQHLMLQSGLAREKWEREDYLPRTIGRACEVCTAVCQDKPVVAAVAGPAGVAAVAAPAAAVPPPPTTGPAVPPPPPPSATMSARGEATFLSPQDAAVLFNGCFYLSDLHRVLVPGGDLLPPDRFRAVFGGRVFALDSRNEKTTRNAFEAFTENQVVAPPIMHGTCFRPDLPFGMLVVNEGRRRVNMYWPADVVRAPGDLGRFHRHVEILFPVRSDRDILLYWMANVVQNPGVKSQWMPLLVGAEGNGKSFFSRVLAYAVGHRFTHWPDAGKLGGTFNAWLYGKLLICIEDLLIGDQGEVWEKLKPMITGESLEIEGKGIDQRTDEVCANFIANSNHKNAIRATLNDRRVSHLWCAQMTAAEVRAAGLDEAYMSSLYDWLRAGGYAAIAHYLLTLPIPAEFGLAWFKGRAPRTTHHAEAVAAGLGPVEQEILDAIERQETGFAGGWVSSGALDKLLERSGRQRAIALNRRREILQALGYDWHPALVNGRVNNPVLPDGAKVKLFVRLDHPDRALATAAEAAAAYTRAQPLMSGIAPPSR